MNQLDIYSRFNPINTDKFFDNIKDAALYLGKVSVNKNYKHTVDYLNRNIIENHRNDLKAGNIISKPTMFNEILSCSYEQTEEINKLFNKEFKRKYHEDIINIFIELVYNYLLDVFTRDKRIKLILHSSGNDSRFISLILKRIKEEKGRDFLGQIYFMCFPPEHEDFLRIMGLEACWKVNQIIPFGYKRRPLDFFAECLEFKNVGINTSEISRALYWDWYIRIFLEEKGGPSNVSVITGRFGNELYRNRMADFVEHFLIYFYDMHFQFENQYDVYDPFACYEVQDLFMNYNFPNVYHIIKALDEDVANVRNYMMTTMKNINKRINNEYYYLSENVRKKMDKNFQNSWYYKKNKLNLSMPQTMMFNKKYGPFDIRKFWKYYAIAAVSQNLINGGCEVS